MRFAGNDDDQMRFEYQASRFECELQFAVDGLVVGDPGIAARVSRERSPDDRADADAQRPRSRENSSTSVRRMLLPDGSRNDVSMP